jgi:hypothetical protein
MKMKSDFVTNSSSTSFIVIDTWEVTSGDIVISQDFNVETESLDITKKFIDYIYGLTQLQAVPNFCIVKNEDHLQLGFEATKGDYTEYFFNYKEPDTENPKEMVTREVYLCEPDFTMNIYNDKSIDVGFHYKTSQSIAEIKKAINQMIIDLIEMLGISNISIKGERRVVDFEGDGWDGGDPWCGYYGESEVCKKEVDGTYKLSIKGVKDEN